jgi:hypothetical protein
MPELAGDLVRLNMNVIFAVTPEAVATVKIGIEIGRAPL